MAKQALIEKVEVIQAELHGAIDLVANGRAQLESAASAFFPLVRAVASLK